MAVYRDVFTNHILCSDEFPVKEIDNVVYVFEGQLVTVSDSQGSSRGMDKEAASEPDARQVINIVERFKLTEVSLDKKSYMAYIKAYIVKVKSYLEIAHPSRVQIFMTQAPVFVKSVMENIDDYVYYTNSDMDMHGAVLLCRYGEDGVTPFFFLLKDGCQAVVADQ
eukprot:ANDGO_03673.mRNA.1 Translationally-controlled tumor protein homolog